ncbi:MAG TPA: AAA family ATPase, partial [bacterium]|nr:AAA family ATPase [bacterium]
SKGNKQKLAIVLALMHKPKLLILDEPTSGLDPLNQQELYSALTETKKWNTTTFFSTHILSEAEKLCDRVGIIKAGKLIAVESVDDFRNKNIRIIHLDTSGSIPLENLKIKGIQKIERTTTGYDLTISGRNADIIKHLAKLPFADLSVAEPSLEEIFMHFYK